ncbi:hypothetical protein ORD22_02575 [Sporosarcina sp. GW1-11]|uniref:hypothetical protein n=1 Tax=Sporosarcina sp. GW1-11 TaxID=2899126 RepID=UPI00294DA09F|nr:hypothetical protein [Sporosarcina sp. GW1-11]MDV6377148.1 hypothetical protein [Sporosarcina sp. GW1-11]
MDKIKVEIKNCYGIDSLENEFDFTKGKSTQVIYAPNGVMKTSFANVFDDYSKGVESQDLIFPMKESVRNIKDSVGDDISPESIFVIRPYDKSFQSDKMSTLLVKDDLRKRYEKVYEQIDITKNILLASLKSVTGLRQGISETFCKSFGFNSNDFFKALESISNEVNNGNGPEYPQVMYNKIFDDKVVSFLETGDFRVQIKDYIEKYDELISKSQFLKKEFNHYHATTVHKNLNENGFFKAEHSINLNIDGEKLEVSNQKDFLKLINSEKEEILKDSDLQRIFNEIDKKISNAQLREFREYLFENQYILIELSDLSALKRKLWISYMKQNSENYNNLLSEYNIGQEELKEIMGKAKSEQTDWENVIEIFNARFYVPYRLSVKNKEDSVLKDTAPSINYFYEEREEQVEMDLLMRVLSQGEKRTLYLLNIIFEIESRKKQGLRTLFIVDDIADSFDYKNKYAIIEYLKEISEYEGFSSIILTHNFDFFRTVQERISGDSKYKGSYMAIKENDCILLEELGYRYISNPLKAWKKDLHDGANLIASVTFARNIAEYIGDKESYNKLTSVLHLKEETKKITVKDLLAIYKGIFRDLDELELENSEKKIYEIIFEAAERIVQSNTESVANLENKVVLSIAIRLNAESYMIKSMNYTEKIKNNQTGYLFGKFKERFPGDVDSIKILEKVNIMTPENIHLNSFMFEPILDISDYHLKQLYNEVLQLSEESVLGVAEKQVTVTNE